MEVFCASEGHYLAGGLVNKGMQVIGEVLGPLRSREKRGPGNGGGHTGQNLVDKHR